jgi:hypothetical protein
LSSAARSPKDAVSVEHSAKRLRQLQALRRRAPRGSFFTVSDLDLMVACPNRKEDRMSVWDGAYLETFRQRLRWWMTLCELMFDDHVQGAEFGDIEALIDETVTQWSRVELMRKPRRPLPLNHISAMYQITNADMELLRRYRRMTRTISKCARRAWPDQDTSWLSVQP